MNEKQANSRYCFVCGVQNQQGLNMTFYTDGPGSSRAVFSVPRSFQGYTGVVHGGVVAAMLDEAAGRTIMGDENITRALVTGRMDIRYRKPVLVETPLLITGKLLEDKGSVVIAQGTITDVKETLLAEAVVTLVVIPPPLKAQFDLKPEDWKVYPD